MKDRKIPWDTKSREVYVAIQTKGTDSVMQLTPPLEIRPGVNSTLPTLSAHNHQCSRAHRSMSRQRLVFVPTFRRQVSVLAAVVLSLSVLHPSLLPFILSDIDYDKRIASKSE